MSKELLSYQKIKLTERQLHPPKQKMKTLKQNNKQIDKKKTVMKWSISLNKLLHNLKERKNFY